MKRAIRDARRHLEKASVPSWPALSRPSTPPRGSEVSENSTGVCKQDGSRSEAAEPRHGVDRRDNPCHDADTDDQAAVAYRAYAERAA
jgi:hypothetical protein